MKHTIKELIIVNVFYLVVLSVSAQTPQWRQEVDKLVPKPSIQTPNAASLGKYGSYQVNSYTGVPDISIPIFEAQSGSLSVPITLSYHASGNRYIDHASWVGLGWSISAGGQISRSVKGRADELSYLRRNINPSLNTCADFTLLNGAYNGLEDMEADLFSYSFPGKGGKFMLVPSSTPPVGHYLVPYEPLAITNGYNYSTFLLPWFEIKDESGNTHRFGNDGINSATESSGTYTTVWQLLSTKAPNSNDVINYSYQNLGDFVSQDVSNNLTVLDMMSNPANNGTDPVMGIQQRIDSYTNTFMAQFAQDEIVFDGGKVKFVATAQNRLDQSALKALDRIEIYGFLNGAYNLQKTYKFVYGYFKDQTNSINLRLKLTELQMLDNTGALVSKYKFGYFTDAFSWDKPANSFNRDWWGFYNKKGGIDNVDMIPQQSIIVQLSNGSAPANLTVGGGDRTTNPALLKEGVLKTITYPTGGTTEFDFEAHKYLENSTAKYAGGLRVTSISSEDGTGGKLIKTYKYGQNESGFGVKAFLDNYYYFNQLQTIKFSGGSIGGGDGSYRSRMYFSSGMVETNSFDGSPVVYTMVTEYEGNASANIGKTIYEFDNDSYTADQVITLPTSTKNYRNSFAWKRGKLTAKTIYDINGNPVEKTLTEYDVYGSDSKLVSQLVTRSAIYGGGVPQLPCAAGSNVGNLDASSIITANFFQVSGALRLKTVTQTSYLLSGNMNKITNYTIDGASLQTLQATTDNGIEALTDVAVYPFNITYPNISLTNSALAWKSLNDKHILNVPIEKYSVRGSGSSARITSGQLTTFKVNAQNSVYVVPAKIYLTELSAPLSLSSYQQASINNSTGDILIDQRYKERVNLAEYDQYGNILQTEKINDQSTSYVWGYNNTLPIAKVENGKTGGSMAAQNIFHTSFEENGVDDINANAKTGKKVWSGSYSITLPANVGTYTLSYWKRPSGIFTWQLITQDVDVNSGNIATTLVVGSPDEILDELRLFPKGAQMTTYTYEPGLGMLTQMDINGVVSKYVYDSFNRLLFIRNEKGAIEKQFQYHYKQD